MARRILGSVQIPAVECVNSWGRSIAAWQPRLPCSHRQKETAKLNNSTKSGSASPERLNGTLLKCPGCRLKFPFSAVDHPLEEKKFPPIGHSASEPRVVAVTHCPQCDGWVAIA